MSLEPCLEVETEFFKLLRKSFRQNLIRQHPHLWLGDDGSLRSGRTESLVTMLDDLKITTFVY